MRKLIIAVLIGVTAVFGMYDATLAHSGLSQTIAATDSDLALSKSDSPDPVQVGDHLTYTLVVTNLGPATSTDVTLEDTLPATADFVSASSSSGACSESSGVVTCDLGNLSMGEFATTTIIVIPNVATDITNTANVRSDENDPNESNNDSVEVTTVIASPSQADISVDKAGSPNPVSMGGSLTFTVEVVNNGPATSTGVTLVDTLPSEVTFSSATTTSGTCDASGGEVTCDLGTLLPHESATVTIVVVADHAGEIVNHVDVDANQVDPVPGNNTASVTVTVVEVATEMQVDIKPGSERNTLNLRSKGLLPVAIIGATDFDVHDIDVSTIRFGVDSDSPRRARPAHRKGGHIGDINGDGIDDMMLHFRTKALGIDRGTERGDIVTLVLTGQMADGKSFDGEDTVTIVGKKKFSADFMRGFRLGTAFGLSLADGDHGDNPFNGRANGNGKSNGKGKGYNFEQDDDDHPSSNGKGKGKSKGKGKGRK